jgi:hypothetical protein
MNPFSENYAPALPAMETETTEPGSIIRSKKAPGSRSIQAGPLKKVALFGGKNLDGLKPSSWG